MPLSGRIGEHYEIVRPLGSGAMGEVYRAVDRKMFDRTVAIKFLSERLTDSEEGRLRFRREVETSARLHHPNIVTIYDWGEHQGRDFFVMEFVDGSDLQVLLKTGVSWDLEQRLEVAFQTADALDFAHRAGVIHRDMKPGNVMVVSSESGPHVKLVDFGIAHVERSNLTQEQSHPGTFTYMAPEQLRGDLVDPLDPRRDVFSLGIVLCELFSGHHPFEAKSEALITNRVLHGDPDPPSRHVAGLPPELDTLILRMLAKDPEQRPGTAREVADALRALSRKAVAQSVGGDAPEDRPRAAFISPRMKEVDSALDAGKVSEALALLSQILRKYPDQTDAAVMLERLVSVAADGIAYGDYRAAIRDASTALRGGDLAMASASCERATTIWPKGPELEALALEISAANQEAARLEETRERLRRQDELVESRMQRAHRLLNDARAIDPVSPDETGRAIHEFGRALKALEPVLIERPDHPRARELRREVLAEIADLEEGPIDVEPPSRRSKTSLIVASAAIAVVLIAVGAIAFFKKSPQPLARELAEALRLPESTEAEVTEKLKQLVSIDALLRVEDERKQDLARQEERLGNLNEMCRVVHRLDGLLRDASGSTASPGGAAKLMSAAEDVWALFQGYRAKLAGDDPTAALLEKQGQSILTEIAERTGSRRLPGAAEAKESP